MDNVLTCVSPADVGLKPGLIEQVCTALAENAVSVSEPLWLSPDHAFDVFFSELSTAQAETTARQIIGEMSIDVLAQPLAHRRKKLLIADMDSTIVQGETLDDLAALAGIGPQIAQITARAMNGELQFEEALRERISMLRGLNASYLEKTATALQLNPGAETLVRTMAGNGAYTALVSGGFRFFTERVARQIGFDLNKGNDLEIIDNCLTGLVIEPILTKTTKLETLYELTRIHAIDMADTLSVGDGANDLPMLQAAGLGVAYYAKPIVVEQARARVSHTDLTSLLFYQGYKKSEFVF